LTARRPAHPFPETSFGFVAWIIPHEVAASWEIGGTAATTNPATTARNPKVTIPTATPRANPRCIRNSRMGFRPDRYEQRHADDHQHAGDVDDAPHDEIRDSDAERTGEPDEERRSPVERPASTPSDPSVFDSSRAALEGRISTSEGGAPGRGRVCSPRSAGRGSVSVSASVTVTTGRNDGAPRSRRVRSPGRPATTRGTPRKDPQEMDREAKTPRKKDKKKCQENDHSIRLLTPGLQSGPRCPSPVRLLSNEADE